MSDRASRPFDLVLFGATGFTGQRAARRLAEVRPDGLSVALAGRREAPLRALAEELDMGVVVADVGDRGSVEAMARAARVLLTTAGPFAVHGDPVVHACASAGT
ncbi:MAG: saccharopine dehydrogenase NADP-binding domain-containing protein, partial [Planctomycetota bacterium]